MDSPRIWAAWLTCALTSIGTQVVNQWWVWSQGSGSALVSAPGRLRDASDRTDIAVATPLLAIGQGMTGAAWLLGPSQGGRTVHVVRNCCGCSIPGATYL
jgi:hypothetical protein